MTDLDRQALDELFRARLDVAVTAVARGPVGNGQETWFVALGDGREVVLRRTAPGGPLEWTDREAEFAILQLLESVDVPTPVPLWSDPSGEALERSYFVMTRLQGDPFMRTRGDERRSAARDLGRRLARLHREAPVPSDAPDPTASTRVELDRWHDRYEADRIAPMPLLGVLLAWLRAEAPQSDRPTTLLWGDPGGHNALQAGGAITAMLDWELAHPGDPLEDVGAAVWSAHQLGDDPGDLLEGYEAEWGAPVDRDALRFFEIMACATRSVMLARAVANYVRGDTAAPNLAGLGLHLLRENLARALELLGIAIPAVELDTPRPPDELRPRPDITETADGITRYLIEEIVPTVDDSALRRGLRTLPGLLATLGRRALHESRVTERRARAMSELLTELGASGVPVADGVEAAGIAVMTDPTFADLRQRFWEHLAADLGLERALLTPLAELYG